MVLQKLVRYRTGRNSVRRVCMGVLGWNWLGYNIVIGWVVLGCDVKY